MGCGLDVLDFLMVCFWVCCDMCLCDLLVLGCCFDGVGGVVLDVCRLIVMAVLNADLWFAMGCGLPFSGACRSTIPKFPWCFRFAWG